MDVYFYQYWAVLLNFGNTIFGSGSEKKIPK
jgi:hypothetical protein